MRSLGHVLRPYALAAVLAIASVVVSVAVATRLGLPLRDPDGFLGPAYVRLPAAVLAMMLIDVVPRAIYRRSPLLQVVRERYGWERIVLVAAGLTVFYLSYVSYRNLKSALPFARPDVLDPQLLELDRLMAFGLNPAVVLHEVFGTGVVAYVLSGVYLFYLGFVPLSLAAALVWGRSARTGSWYVTALCLNWLLGVATYYLVPSLGPVFVRPELYADLPPTGVAAMQDNLAAARLAVLADPVGAGTIASVAGFASLHVSVVFTAAIVAHRLRLPQLVRWSLWLFLGATMLATAYFGWHYLVDIVAGLALGAVAAGVAEHASGRTGARPPSQDSTTGPVASGKDLRPVGARPSVPATTRLSRGDGVARS